MKPADLLMDNDLGCGIRISKPTWMSTRSLLPLSMCRRSRAALDPDIWYRLLTLTRIVLAISSTLPRRLAPLSQLW